MSFYPLPEPQEWLEWDSWFWYHFVPPLVAFKYTIFSRLLAFFSIKSAWKLNAEFEDHAEHTFMQFVKDNPQLEEDTLRTVLDVLQGRWAYEQLIAWADQADLRVRSMDSVLPQRPERKEAEALLMSLNWQSLDG